MPGSLVLDASILVKLYLPEAGSEAAEALVYNALAIGDDLFGPAFLPAEVLSVLRRARQRGIIPLEQAEVAFDAFFSLPIDYVDGREVYERAWRLAADLDLPVLYDAVYLAVAELREATFWTADESMLHLARAAGLPYVRALPASPPA